jgi:hypothetical protein
MACCLAASATSLADRLFFLPPPASGWLDVCTPGCCGANGEPEPALAPATAPQHHDKQAPEHHSI